MRTALPSIRKRLTRALLAWSVAWGVTVSAAVWFVVEQEVDELLDDTLQAAAAVLRTPLSQQALTTTRASTGDDLDLATTSWGSFAWQVVDYAGNGGARVLLASPLAPPTALQDTATAGIGDVAEWRVFGTPLNDGRLWLYVAQTQEERREAQIEVAVSAALATLAMALLAHFWLHGQLRHELLPLQRLADRLGDEHDPGVDSSMLGAAERAELEPVHAAIDALAARLTRRLAQERAFTSHAAHALRTPLAGIDAQLAVALREAPRELQPRLQRVRTAASRLQRVVHALLMLFRSGAEPQRQALDVAVIVARLPVDGLTIDVESRQALLADPDLVAAALLNLFDNSLRNGATQVRVTLPEAGVLRVEDNGPGVSDEQRERLQAALAEQNYEGNTGLGLLLADLVARAHGGGLHLPVSASGFAAELRFGAEPAC